MTCEKCHSGEVEPTQVSGVSETIGKIGYGIGTGAVLTVGASVGLGLALVREGGMDLARFAVPAVIVLLVCAPLLLVTALRMLAEKQVWRCRSCAHTFERA
jgi:hypothetical protein